jgi:hypothetical protein
MGAHVLGDGLLRALADVQAAKVYSDFEREPFV